MKGRLEDDLYLDVLNCGRRMDEEAKLMRSRVSARECRARKKKRYQKLESMADSKERIVLQLREELQKLYQECKALDASVNEQQ